MVRSRVATPPRRFSPARRRARAAANIFRGISLAAEHAEASSRGGPPPRVCRVRSLSRCVSLQRRDYFGLRNSARREIRRRLRIRIRIVGRGDDGNVVGGTREPRKFGRRGSVRAACSSRAEICLATCHGAPRVAADTQRARLTRSREGRGGQCCSPLGSLVRSRSRCRCSRDRESSRGRKLRLSSVLEKSSRGAPNGRNMFRCRARNVVGLHHVTGEHVKHPCSRSGTVPSGSLFGDDGLGMQIGIKEIRRKALLNITTLTSYDVSWILKIENPMNIILSKTRYYCISEINFFSINLRWFCTLLWLDTLSYVQ